MNEEEWTILRINLNEFHHIISQPMPLLEHNGPDFKYIVTWVQLNGTDQKPSSKTIGTKAAWHYIVKNRYEPYEPFNVSVRVVNSMGTSLANTSWVLGYSGEDS